MVEGSRAKIQIRDRDEALGQELQLLPLKLPSLEHISIVSSLDTSGSYGGVVGAAAAVAEAFDLSIHMIFHLLSLTHYKMHAGGKSGNNGRGV